MDVDGNFVQARIYCAGPQSNSAHTHWVCTPNISSMVNEIDFQIKGCLQISAFVLGDLLTKFKETSSHEVITDNTNRSSHFVEITNLLLSTKPLQYVC